MRLLQNDSYELLRELESQNIDINNISPINAQDASVVLDNGRSIELENDNSLLVQGLNIFVEDKQVFIRKRMELEKNLKDNAIEAAKHLNRIKELQELEKNNSWYDIFLQNPTTSLLILTMVGISAACLYGIIKQSQINKGLNTELKEENTKIKEIIIDKMNNDDLKNKLEKAENKNKMNENIIYLLGGGIGMIILKKLK